MKTVNRREEPRAILMHMKRHLLVIAVNDAGSPLLRPWAAREL
jgi:hypothetical protein